MHTAISCATCTRPLRIPTALLGQQVCCPFCTDTFVAVADVAVKLDEPAAKKAARREETARASQAVVLLEPEPPVVEESFTVDFAGPETAPAPLQPWLTRVVVRSDSDRRLWGEMQAEISGEGVRLFRGRKELNVPVGCEATKIGGSVVRVVVGSRTVDFQLKKRHIYKSRLAADLAGFLNGDRPMPANQGYRWPWYQWLMLLAPLSLLGVLLAGELPETPMKPLKGFAIFLFAVLGPLLVYTLWHVERLRVGLRWTGASLLVGGLFLSTASMYFFGPRLPPAAPYANWLTYSPPGGRYSISMPAAPFEETEWLNGRNWVRLTARVKPEQTFIVAYADFADRFEGQDYLRAKYPRLSFVQARSKLPTTDTDDFVVYPDLRNNQRAMNVRVFAAGNRLYILIASDAIGNNNTRFLDSFQTEVLAQPELPSPLNMNGLTAYWSFDEGAGLLAGEQTGKLPSALLIGCQWTNGRRGKGIKMSGAENAYFEYGASPTLDFAAKDSFTFSGWFRTTERHGMIVSQRNSNDAIPMIDVFIEDSRLMAEVRRDGNGGAPPGRVNGTLSVSDGKWHHFALVREVNGAIELYRDGQSLGRNTSPSVRGSITTDLRALGCELYQQQGINFGNVRIQNFQGSMDEFCIFHRRLSEQEINQLAGKRR